MRTSANEPAGRESVVARFPTTQLPAPEIREMPAPPQSWFKLIGPGIIAAGVGLASGEFILYPYIASQVGLVFVWAALVGLVTQFFINMEIERYTLATGETALTGFSRFWRHWGLVFALMTFFANLWPGWATSSATIATYLWGGNANYIAIGMLLVIGATLTLAPVVYTVLERIEMVKVAAVLLLLVVGATVAVTASDWADTSQVVTDARIPVSELGFAVLLGALAFAGGGGGQNLVQSNWIRDKRFGMGAYVPRITSPVTGEAEAAPSTGYTFEMTPQNLNRWRSWWKFANIEQLSTFVLITFLSIFFTSLLAYSTVFGAEGLPDDIGFLEVEGNALKDTVAPWFGTFFWVIGAFSLFAAALGIVDYTCRLVADVIKTSYAREANESKLYFGLVWAIVIIGIIELLIGIDQPLVLIVISACVGGLMMFMYSGLLILTNRNDPVGRAADPWVPARGDGVVDRPVRDLVGARDHPAVPRRDGLSAARVGSLRGRVAVVTGASRGVGRGIALGLGEAGATVYVSGRTVDEGTSAARLPGSVPTTAAEVTKLGGVGIAAPCDAGDDRQLAALIDRVREEQGRLDVLVNSAWGGYERFTDGSEFNPGPFWEQPLGLWDSMHRIGVRAHYVTTALAAPLMIASGGGLVVSLSSFAGQVFVPPVPYGVAHAAIDRLARDMAEDLRPHGWPRCRCTPAWC